MAKISAHGAAKIMQASKSWTDEDGWDHQQRLALRSDGKVLGAHDLRSPTMRENYGSRGWNRGGYSIVVDLRSAVSLRETFTAYAESRGFEVKS